MSEKRRSVVAFVNDAIYPYHCRSKKLCCHQMAQRLVDRATVDVYTMQWSDGPRVRTDGPVTYHALYWGDRSSFRQAIIFAFACPRLVRCRFDAPGVVCAPPATVIARTVRRLLADPGAKPNDAAQQGRFSLTDYNWDAVTDRAAEMLQI